MSQRGAPYFSRVLSKMSAYALHVKSIPWKRAAEAAEIGRLAVFLASADSYYVTGSTYFMDGGLMQNIGQGA